MFIDDILIYSSNLDEHETQLNWLISKLAAFNLKINPKKSDLVKEEVEFLGHLVSRGTLKPLNDKIIAIQNCPVPKNRTELQKFLGLAQYYRRFIQGFSKIAAPLFELTAKDGVD